MKRYDQFLEDTFRKRSKIKSLIDRKTSTSARIAENLTLLRKKAGLTQRDLAEITGWKQSYIARLENIASDQLPSLETIKRYAKACGLEVSLLFCKRQGSSNFEVIQASAITDDEDLLAYCDDILKEESS